MSFKIGNLRIDGDLILSPMAGFSDLPYRSLCRRHGSAMSYSEFVSVIAILRGENDRTKRMLSYLEEERPVVFQIFDSQENRILEAAKRIEQLGPDIIDLNMGCSVRHVSGRGAGAGLLKHPVKIGKIFEKLVTSVNVPVTGKIRLGWDENSLNYLEVARVLELSGAALIAVHGRTRDQSYGTQADWNAIREIVETVHIPVIGNGDVRTTKDIADIKSQTGCAAVMIGRGAIGHPWIFENRDRWEVHFEEKVRFVRKHFNLMIEFYGEKLALLLIRKHITRYLKGTPGIHDLQQKLVRVGSVFDFHRLLDEAVIRSQPCTGQTT